MIELVAQGSKPGQRWRRLLGEGQTAVLGRDEGTWAIPWDPWISRRHAELRWQGDRLHVRRLPTALNPIYFRGERAPESFDVRPAEQFVIGETSFFLERQQTTLPVEEESAGLQTRTINAEQLRRLPFRDASRRLDVLSQLPKMISCAASDKELFTQLTNLLLAGIPRADAAALVAVDPETAGSSEVRVLCQDSRAPGSAGFRPRRRLVREAAKRVDETVLHVWPSGDVGQGQEEFTLQGNFDWAFCTPVRNEVVKGWGLYVTGRFSGNLGTALAPWEDNDLSDDLKFAELAAAILGSLRQGQALQQRQVLLSRFLSPEVMHVLATQAPQEALKPREAEVAVLFCDLRGFSRKVERESCQLLAMLQRVSTALEVMTENILGRKGVIGDFHGDAAMGFWGWPLDDPERAERACMAALGIRIMFELFGATPGHPLAGFQVGIGLAAGKAVAGQIGTRGQAKVTVFGPVVNLASRLEGMTKLLRVPILVDEATARAVKERQPSGPCRFRRLARVLPYGLDTPLVVSELLPPADEAGVLSDEHLGFYEQALDAFLRGDWVAAYELLHRVPPQDHGKDLLTGYILQHNHVPPAGWDGVVRLESK